VQVRAFDQRGAAERSLAEEIAALIRAAEVEQRGFVLGLATGTSPLGVYAELARLHRAGRLSFAHVHVFHLDEFAGVAADHPASFRRFLRAHLLDALDLDPRRVHLLDGEGHPEEVCAAYEAELRAAGGIDLQILGLGLNGHVGFNEPGSERASRTRRVELHPVTRAACAAVLGCEVPAEALTLGIATIRAARRLRLLAFGAHKAEVFAALRAGAPGAELPAAYLSDHGDAVLLADAAALSAGGRA
jgi:glucosamine-6-phosphate deaminase